MLAVLGVAAKTNKKLGRREQASKLHANSRVLMSLHTQVQDVLPIMGIQV